MPGVSLSADVRQQLTYLVSQRWSLKRAARELNLPYHKVLRAAQRWGLRAGCREHQKLPARRDLSGKQQQLMHRFAESGQTVHHLASQLGIDWRRLSLALRDRHRMPLKRLSALAELL